MVFPVVNVILTEESLNNFVIYLVSLPIQVNFAHLDPFGLFLLRRLEGVFSVNTSYLLFCRMFLIILLSFSLSAGLKLYRVFHDFRA